MSRAILSIMVILLLIPAVSSATSAITCHCFTDRSYDPSQPALADPYFLATTQNSFFAEFFNVDKRTVVMKKQTGSSADDLWVAYWVASRSGLAGEALLAELSKKGEWKSVITPLRLSVKVVGERFAAAVSAGAPSSRLAREIIDGVLIRHGLLRAQDVSKLRNERTSNQEIIITALIAAKTRQSPITVFRSVKSGAYSWGAFLNEAKISPSAIQQEFARLLK